MFKSYIYTATLVLSCLLFSCKHNKNARYVIYKVETSSRLFTSYNTLNDTINAYLKNKLQGKRYDLTFQPEYISLKSVEVHDELLLAKSLDRDSTEVYADHIDKSGAYYTFALKKGNDNELVLDVELSLPGDRPIFIPVQFGNMPPSPKSGRAICYLTKIDE